MKLEVRKEGVSQSVVPSFVRSFGRCKGTPKFVNSFITFSPKSAASKTIAKKFGQFPASFIHFCHQRVCQVWSRVVILYHK